MKLYLLCLFAFLGGVTSQADSEIEEYFEDYDNNYDYDFLKEASRKLDRELKQLDDGMSILDINKSVEDLNHSLEESDKASKIDEYQFEDNKEEVKETKASGESLENIDNIETLAKDSGEQENKNDDSGIVKDKEGTETSSKEGDDYALLWGDNEPAPLPPPIADDKAIFDETQEILNEVDDVNDFEEEKKDISLPVTDEQLNLEDILDETKKILADNENDFDLPNTSSEETIDDNSAKEEFVSEEDTVDNVKQDLDDDLKELFETLDKLSENGSEAAQETQEVQETEEANSNFVLDYEEKYGKPYHEGLVLSQRADMNDYEEIDSNLSEIFAKTSEMSEVSDYKDTGDSFISPDDDTKGSSETKTHKTKQSSTIMYQNDALVDEDNRAGSDEVEEFKGLPQTTLESDDTLPQEYNIESTTKASLTTETSHRRTMMVDDLSSAELDDLMGQFSILHSEDLDVHAADFDKNVAPIHITLKVDEPTVVTSPNYPLAYPTNNIVDWILEGEGVGIEMNITDFAVNGAIGDYVLVKPGGVDESGHEGIIFSYRLNSERRYRFTDVDRLFMRFESKVGMSFLRGFSMSFRMISHPPEEPEDTPEPEAVIDPPSATLTVNLAGVNAIEFKKVREEFRQLVADVASLYIRHNKIDPGMNTTIEVTQITNQALCNIHWPGHENCVEVTLGVPLTYEEGMEYRLNQNDLETMWKTYMKTEEFRRRLMLLGVEEFITPDDRSVMTVWLVIAAGVVISMAMLAFALWRFSCFDDYTRMKAFSDTDSIKNQKRDLDLYPTPHQTLPPLYSENEYKWPDHNKFEDSTRVDMAGFANRSYVRDDLYDFDSDEEVIPNRDRFTTDV